MHLMAVRAAAHQLREGIARCCCSSAVLRLAASTCLGQSDSAPAVDGGKCPAHQPGLGSGGPPEEQQVPLPLVLQRDLWSGMVHLAQWPLALMQALLELQRRQGSHIDPVLPQERERSVLLLDWASGSLATSPVTATPARQAAVCTCRREGGQTTALTVHC